jgi:hypothetical protein
MSRVTLATGLALLATFASAQNETVWSSVAYVLYGERTPLRTSIDPNLTPLGAQQLFSLGNVLRARWLDKSVTYPGITDFKGMQGISQNAIDNSQLDILSMSDEYVVASAQAFMQGLYPPKTSTFLDMEDAVLANHTLVDFPLNGYQYPRVQTLSVVDPTSTW